MNNLQKNTRFEILENKIFIAHYPSLGEDELITFDIKSEIIGARFENGQEIPIKMQTTNGHPSLPIYHISYSTHSKYIITEDELEETKQNAYFVSPALVAFQISVNSADMLEGIELWNMLRDESYKRSNSYFSHLEEQLLSNEITQMHKILDPTYMYLIPYEMKDKVKQTLTQLGETKQKSRRIINNTRNGVAYKEVEEEYI